MRTSRAPKTVARSASVSDFLDAVPDAGRREDGRLLATVLTEITGEPPVLWGDTLIGFGRYAYTYDSGHSGEAFLAGFSPRKANMVVYVGAGFEPFSAQLAQLGKHKLGKSCLYLGRLSDIDMDVLRAIVARSVAIMKAKYPS